MNVTQFTQLAHSASFAPLQDQFSIVCTISQVLGAAASTYQVSYFLVGGQQLTGQGPCAFAAIEQALEKWSSQLLGSVEQARQVLRAAEQEYSGYAPFMQVTSAPRLRRRLAVSCE